MRYILTVTLVLLGCSAALAQTQTTSGAAEINNTASLDKTGQAVNLESGTRLAAQLQSTLDVRRARVGDQVVLKTTEAIKANGQTIVKKGARLIGHVTEVQQRAGGRGESSIGLVFDRLESGSLAVPISATINSITQARTQARSSNDDDLLNADADARSSTSTRAQQPSTSGNGGLLGGATGAVGGILDTTTGAAGSVVNDTTGAVGGTVDTLGRTTRSVRISQSTSADVEGHSTLSLAGDNLRLEKGTAFRLTLNQATSVGGNQ